MVFPSSRLIGADYRHKMRLMGTRLPWCAVVFLAACHAGPGDFPGTYGQPRFVATMKASTGAMYSQDDRNETVNLEAAETDGSESTDFVIKVAGDTVCTLFAVRSDSTAKVLATQSCAYTLPDKSSTFKLDVQSGTA